jgi:hypothetical protein
MPKQESLEKLKCKWCSNPFQRGPCYRHCQESEDGIHEPDTCTFHLEHDGDGVYLDVNCKHCGQSGCVGKFDAKEVTWD